MAYLGTIIGGPVHIRNSEETYTKFPKELYPYPGGDFYSSESSVAMKVADLDFEALL